MRKNYEHQLQELVQSVLDMGNKVHGRLEQALKAMAAHDIKQADSIGKADDDLDRDYMDLEKDCSDLLALQQPVASDLRLITASFKIITDLERIGDLIVNLTDYTKEMKESHLLDERKIMELGNFAGQMIADSLQAYKAKDVEKSREIARRDNDMDQKCEQCTTGLLHHLIEWDAHKLPQDRAEEEGQRVLVELLTIRDLERVADHAVNIAARTVYMVTTKRDLL